MLPPMPVGLTKTSRAKLLRTYATGAHVGVSYASEVFEKIGGRPLMPAATAEKAWLPAIYELRLSRIVCIPCSTGDTKDCPLVVLHR